MRRALTGLVALLLTSSCGGAADRGSVEGLVVDVEGDLVTVTEFTVLTDAGQMRFTPAPDGDFAFPLPHLREHIISGAPVVVFWEERDGTMVAVLVDDAGDSPH
ncbi:MAG: hypothetical protein ACFCVC_16455 [Acidimicrobiia bacterium]